MFGGTTLKLKLIFIPCQENKYRPGFLDGRFLYYYLIFLLILKIIAIPFFVYFPKTIFFADITKIALIELTNQARESLGLSVLKENPKLSEAAYLKAKDILEKDYFSHSSPAGVTPWYWFSKSGYNYQLAGENLAIGFLDSEEVYDAWLDSPSHKENILNSSFSEIGIATLKGDFQGNETTVVVQLFGAPQIVPQINEKLKEEAITKVETQKEEPLSKQVAGESEVIPKETPAEIAAPVVPAETSKNSLTSSLFSFMSSNYYNLFQKILYGSLIFVLVSLLATVFFDIFVYRKFEIQYKDMVFRAVGFSIILALLLLFDKTTIIQLIPHNFSIY